MTRRLKPRLYYMCPENVRGTQLEHDQLAHLHFTFGYDWYVVDPKVPEHVAEYENLKLQIGNGAPYPVNSRRGCVFLPFRDGRIPLGMDQEIESFLRKGYRVWELRHDGRLSPLRELSKKRVLSEADTNVRIRNEDGSLKPY